MNNSTQEYVYEGADQNLTLHGVTHNRMVISAQGIAFDRGGAVQTYAWKDIVELRVKDAFFYGDNAWTLVLLLSNGETVKSFTLVRKNHEPLREMKSLLLEFHYPHLLKNPDELAKKFENRHRLRRRLSAALALGAFAWICSGEIKDIRRAHRILEHPIAVTGKIIDWRYTRGSFYTQLYFEYIYHNHPYSDSDYVFGISSPKRYAEIPLWLNPERPQEALLIHGVYAGPEKYVGLAVLVLFGLLSVQGLRVCLR